MGGTRRRYSRRLVLALGALLAFIGALYAQRAGLSLSGALPQRHLAAGADLAQSIERELASVAHTWITAHPAQEQPFMWGQGVLMLGLDCAGQHVRDPSAAAEIDGYVRRYYEAHAARGVTFTWSDQLTPAIAAADRLARGELARRQVVDDAVQYALHAPRTSERGAITHFGRSWLRHLSPPFPEAWVDSLFHVVPLLVRHGQLMGASRELDVAADQVVRFMRVLQDPVAGLITHAFSERDGEVVRQPPLAAQAFWLRGQAWVLASGVEVWAALYEEHPLRAELAERLQRLARALVAQQAASGLFHTLVTQPDSYEETAGSALVVYALERGVTAQLLGGAAHQAALRGMRGLLSIVAHDGERSVVTGTSLGTNPWPEIYRYVPTASDVSYGVGAWLMAACQLAPSRGALDDEVRN